MTEATASEGESALLHERLGGVYAIATVVDDFIDRVMTDGRLNANPAVDAAHHKVPPAGLKYLVTEMLCWAAGGPRTLHPARTWRARTGISTSPSSNGTPSWTISTRRSASSRCRLPERAKVVAIVRSTYTDIVTA